MSNAALTVLLDLRHPFAYLGLRPTLELVRELQIEIDWLPVRVPPFNRPSEPAPDDDRGILHRRHRAHAIAREIDVYAAAAGLTIREPYRDPDPAAFELGWTWLRERAPERLERYLTEGFRRYWRLELDPSSISDVDTLVGDARFETWAMDGDSRSSPQKLHPSTSPAYVLGDELFQGRQHLPMLRWLLTGRTGRGPI